MILQPQVVVCSAALSTCEKGPRWEVFLGFLVGKPGMAKTNSGSKMLIAAGWWLEPWNFMTFHSVGNVIIPTDFHIFQRG